MIRDLLGELKKWKNSPTRVPLILRGARQVGKSWLVDKFAEEFDYYVKINFDKDVSIAKAFAGDVNVPILLEKLALYSGKRIVPGRTLLFLDEIQECEDALRYIRYFKEEYQQLHVVAAGSLLDFKIEKIGIPVGRVDFLHVTPLSFGEFLTASGRSDLREFTFLQKNDPSIDALLKEYLRRYIWLGGMPEVVRTWIEHEDVAACQEIQDRLILAYREDFAKYAKDRQIEYVDKVFSHIPKQMGAKFKYVNVDRDTRSSDLKEALLLLEKAGVAHMFFHTSAQMPPLGSRKDDRRFKVFFLDIGLAQRILGMTHQDWMINTIKVENLGGLSEQLVAQELVAYLSGKSKAEVFYWHRESKNSNAEVDALIAKDSHIIPIEIKAGKKGRLKSLQAFLDTHPNATYGLKISEQSFSSHGSIKEIPFYGIEGWLVS